jgi:hypothetical protein
MAEGWALQLACRVLGWSVDEIDSKEIWLQLI